MKIFFLILIFLLNTPYSYAVDKKNQDQEESEDVKDYFTDSNGNILEPNAIPSLKTKIDKWDLLTGFLDGRKVCYAVTRPFAKVGNHKDARDAYLMVAYYNKKRQDINISSGYTYKTGSKITISVDGSQYSGKTYENIAMSPSRDVDLEIIRHMLHGKRLMVKADSKIGTYSVDAYSLEKFEEVYAKLVELCDYL